MRLPSFLSPGPFSTAPSSKTACLKILLYTDLTIRPDQLFWHRDLGLLSKAFRDLGHDAYLVVHPATEPPPAKTIPNELDHPREQPCEAQQGLPRLSVAGTHSEIRNSKSPTPPVLWPSPPDVRNASCSQSQKPVSSIAVTSMSFVLPPVAIGNSGKIPTCPTNMPATTSLLLSTLWNRETKD